MQTIENPGSLSATVRLLVKEFARGEQAFRQAGNGFTVTDIQTVDARCNLSEQVPPYTWFVLAIKVTEADFPVRMHYSSSYKPEWNHIHGGLLIADSSPRLALDDMFALPCTHASFCDAQHISIHHHTWLHVDKDISLQVLSCPILDPRDELHRLTRNVPVVALGERGMTQWRGGLSCFHYPYDDDMFWREVQLLRKAAWMVRHRYDEDAADVKRDALTERQKKLAPPGELISALRYFGEMFQRLDIQLPAQISDWLRSRWAASFEQFGIEFLMAPKLEMTMQDLRTLEHTKCRMQGYRFLTDLREARNRLAAAVVQRCFRRAIADPHFEMCRSRLAREWQQMKTEV